MFGFFKKFSPEDVGKFIAENSITYSEPVMIGLMKIGSIDFDGSEEAKKEFGYSLMLNTGSAVMPMVIHYLREIDFDHDAFLQGAKSYFDSFAEVYSRELNIQVSYDFDACVNFTRHEIETNTNFLQTKRFYGNGDSRSVYAEVIRFLAVKTAPDSFSTLPPFSDADISWHHVLEAIDGLDRSFRWSTECFNFSKMKKR